MEKYKIDIKSFFIISIFSISIFLWGFNLPGIQLRFLYLVLLIPLIYFTLFKKKKYNFSILIGYFCFFLVIFLINYKSIIVSPKLIFSNILFFLTIVITVYYWRYLKNIDYLIGIFLFCLIVSIIITGEIVMPSWNYTDAELVNTDISVKIKNFGSGNWTDKCGGITVNFIDLFRTESLLAIDSGTFSKTDHEKYSKLYGISYLEILHLNFSYLRDYKVVIAENLFKENSHLAILAPAIILYLIHRICNSNTNALILFFIAILFIIFYIKSTSIFFLGIILSFLIIFIFNMRQFSKKLIIVYFILISLLSFNFLSDIACQKRYVPATNYISKIVSAKINLIKNNFFKQSDHKENVILKPDIKTTDEMIFLPDPEISTSPNESTSVLLRSFEIAVKSIKDKPLGWGINNFQQAGTNYEKDLNIYKSYENHEWVIKNSLNFNDGSSTLLKMIVELGLLSIVPFLIIALYVFSNKVPLGEKLFFFSLIFTQLIRGVGYFNSGFLIVLVFISLSYFEKEMIYFNKKNKI